jgi:hypothetical protein
MSFAGELLPAALSSAMSPWRLVEQVTQRRSRQGDEQVVVLGYPYWEFEVETPPLSEENFRLAMAFIDRRRGERITFTAYPRPDGTPLGVAAGADSSVTVTAIDAEASTVTFGNVGASAASAGDFIGYYTAAGGFWVGRIAENQAASGGAYTLKVNPPPFPAHATPLVKRTNPLGEFVMLEPVRSRNLDRRQVRFTARQVCRG